MKINARFQSVIDLLVEVYRNVDVPVDVVVNSYMRQRRFIGSTDRREILDVFYGIIRQRKTIDGFLTNAHFVTDDIPQRSRLQVFVYLLKYADNKNALDYFDGEQYSPSKITLLESMVLDKLEKISLDQLSEAAQLGVDEDVLLRLKRVFPETYKKEITAQEMSAPLDLRWNPLKGELARVEAILTKEKIPFEKPSYSPWGIRLKSRIPLGQHKLITQGLVEIQDEGSQLIAMAVDAQPGQFVWDYCAGAGGKTLAIAPMMNNKGRIIATDSLEWRLKKAPIRFRRAGIHNAECKVLNVENQKWVKRQHGKCDRVLVDAPCSGSGTWRRNPELKWRVSDTDLKELVVKQSEILSRAALLVKSEGYLIYATCSLYREENQDQIEAFLKTHPDFSVHPIQLNTSKPLPLSAEGYLQLTPGEHQTDGFFACVMVKK